VGSSATDGRLVLLFKLLSSGMPAAGSLQLLAVSLALSRWYDIRHGLVNENKLFFPLYQP
jgi:hypothetical protein